MGHKTSYSFKYKFDNGAYRPIIPVEIQKKNGSEIVARRILVLVDSGADRCIFWGEIGDALGIKVRSGRKEPIYGISGDRVQTWGYTHRVGLKVGNETINTTALFSYDIPNGLAVVGQKDFFENFVVKFDYKDKSVTLRRC